MSSLMTAGSKSEAPSRSTKWPLAASIWASGYGLLGVYWAVGGAGFPFGASDPDPGIAKGMSILGGVRRDTAAPIIAFCALLAAATAVVLAVRIRRHREVVGPIRLIGEGVAWLVAA